MFGFKLLPVVALVATCAFGMPAITKLPTLYARQTYTGDATYYYPGLNACGTTDGPDSYIAAVSYSLFDSYPGATSNPNNNPICGRSITATAPNGNSVTVTITDRCASCNGFGDLDLSPDAFQQLDPLSVGRISGVTWHYN